MNDSSFRDAPAPATPPAALGIVRPEWVDSYGHMNLAYYLVAFDMAVDVFWPRIGLGAPLRAHGLGTFAAESWVAYRRELLGGMPIAATSEVVALDEKRLLVRHHLHHAEEGWESAVNELLFLCVDLTTRKVRPWPEDIMAGLQAAPRGGPPLRLALKRPAAG